MGTDKEPEKFDLGEELLGLHSEKNENAISPDIQKLIDSATPVDIQTITKALAEIKSEAERDYYVQKFSKKLGLSKRAIQKDLKALTERIGVKEDNMLVTGYFPGLVDLGIDNDGAVVFIVKDGNELEIKRDWEIDGQIYVPPDKENLPFKLPRAEKVETLYKENDVQIFQDLIAYFRRFSYLPDNIWELVAYNTFLTYIQDNPEVQYLPMLLFWAVPERGKSRTGKAVTFVSYRGIHLVDLREANLFRYSEDLRATTFFDMMNLWKKAERNGAEDILLLRYEKGAKVSRVLSPDKGPFNDMKHFSVYGPTLIATNEAVHKILDTRCIPITMPNKPGNYENPSAEKAQELKDRLTAWRAKVMDAPLPEIEPVQGLSGRLWDISRSLLQVCQLINPQGSETLKETLLDIAGERMEDRRETIEGRIVAILLELSPEDSLEWEVETEKILARLNDGKPEDKQFTAQRLGKKLTAMGIPKRKAHGYSRRKLERDMLNALISQYIGEESPKTNSPNSPLSPKSEISMISTGDIVREYQDAPLNSPHQQTLDSKGTGECRASGESYGESMSEGILDLTSIAERN